MNTKWQLASVVVILAGCGAPGAVPQSVALAQSAPSIVGRSRPERSWMAIDARNHDLLYVSAGVSVYVFTYPQGKLVGELSVPARPQGECVDKAGDVFVPISTESGPNFVYEYGHGAAHPKAILSDAVGYPVGCAVDPQSGDLAVTNEGNVAIYSHASGNPTTYSLGFFNLHYCGYDNAGNLFVDALTPNNQIAELPKGGSWTNITLNRSLNYPGQIQWDGSRITVADRDSHSTAIYRLRTSGSSGFLAGGTLFRRAENAKQSWIQGDSVIIPYLGRENGHYAVGLWNYAKGGFRTEILQRLNIHGQGAYGVVVSLVLK